MILLISNITKNSELFNLDKLLEFESEISREYNISTNTEDERCYIINPRALRFEKLVSKMLKLLREYANMPEHDPYQRNFDEPAFSNAENSIRR